MTLISIFSSQIVDDVIKQREEVYQAKTVEHLKNTWTPSFSVLDFLRQIPFEDSIRVGGTSKKQQMCLLGRCGVFTSCFALLQILKCSSVTRYSVPVTAAGAVSEPRQKMLSDGPSLTFSGQNNLLLCRSRFYVLKRNSTLNHSFRAINMVIWLKKQLFLIPKMLCLALH